MEEIYFEPITEMRMREYYAKSRELYSLLQKKKLLLIQYGVSGINYGTIKVTAGNGHRNSHEESYVSAIQKINAEINYYLYNCFGVYGIIEERQVILTQFNRMYECADERNMELIPSYIKLLRWRYLLNLPTKIVRFKLFGHFSDYKENQHTTYKDKYQRWHQNALKLLEKVSEKPYVPVTKQLTIGESNEAFKRRNIYDSVASGALRCQ